MTPKYLLPCVLGLTWALLPSCAPLIPYNQGPPLRAMDPGLEPAPGTVNAPSQKKLKEARERAIEPRDPTPGTSSGGSGETMSGGSGGGDAPAQPRKPDYPYALSIPGKDGFVFNPYTNNPVDVRGIPSGTLVRDPQDANPDHKFRVP